jgi:MarR family transcriptional regulator, organic hydroperoxide resistance regulator
MPLAQSRPGRPRPRLVQLDASTTLELDEGLEFMRTLWVVVHALQKASKRMNQRLGVTGPQRLVVRVVGLSPGISAGALAKALHLHPSTLTGVLKRLESQRLLSRASHEGDARRAVLRLTPAGQQLNLAVSGTVESAVRATLPQVSTRDRHAARDVLRRLAVALDATQPVMKARARTRKRTA